MEHLVTTSGASGVFKGVGGGGGGVAKEVFSTDQHDVKDYRCKQYNLDYVAVM